jgi:hypothetical protein
VSGVRLLQPVPGDPGIRLGDAADAAAMAAGAAAVPIGAGVALVHRDGGPSRGWASVDVETAVPLPQPQALTEAERAMRQVMRDAEGLLAEISGRDAAPEVLSELARLRAQPAAPLPAGHPAAAVALLALTQRLRPALALATTDDPTVTGAAAHRRRDLLRELSGAVRRAECAAIDAGIPATGATQPRR